MAATQKTTKKKPARSTDRRNIWLLIITTLLVLGSVFMFMPPQEKINQGLDIQGGLSVVLTAKSTDGADVTNDDMEKSRAIIESRVNALGASEAVAHPACWWRSSALRWSCCTCCSSTAAWASSPRRP